MTADRVVLVTGCNRGIGLAIADHLSHAGWQVWGLNRTPAADPVYREILCDLADPRSVADALDTVVRTSGRIDVLIANAAVRSLGPIATLPIELWREAMETNLGSVVSLVQLALLQLRQSRGLIVLMGSHAGSHYFEGGGAYCVSKAGLKALAEVLLLEERPHGVRTTLVSPGAIANEVHDESPFKISCASIAQAIESLLGMPSDLVVGELEVRPSVLPHPVVTGLDRLQAV